MREPQPFGRYLLLERVAVGGVGEVFAARVTEGPEAGRQVALKRLLPHLADDPAQVERFLGEARLGRLAAHPAAVRVLDHGRVDGRWFLALEWVAGLDLARVLAALEPGGERLPADLAVRVGLRVAEALDHLHVARGPDGRRLGLAHRDVAPANVLLGFAGEVKLADLGLAGSGDDQPGAPRGRRAWRAPELEAGAPAGPGSDLYAAAAVLRRLLGPGDGLPAALDRAVNSAMAAEPALRPSAAAWAEALRPFAGDASRLGAWLSARFPAEARRERERWDGRG